jgi:hypothetical protein
MGDIRVWGRKSSVNVQLVLWTLDELNLAYQRVDAGFHLRCGRYRCVQGR